MQFIQEMVDKHRPDFDENEMRDFTDYFIKSQVNNDPDSISGWQRRERERERETIK